MVENLVQNQSKCKSVHFAEFGAYHYCEDNDKELISTFRLIFAQ